MTMDASERTTICFISDAPLQSLDAAIYIMISGALVEASSVP
jgi:hypothetical protein